MQTPNGVHIGPMWTPADKWGRGQKLAKSCGRLLWIMDGPQYNQVIIGQRAGYMQSCIPCGGFTVTQYLNTA